METKGISINSSQFNAVENIPRSKNSTEHVDSPAKNLSGNFEKAELSESIDRSTTETTVNKPNAKVGSSQTSVRFTVSDSKDSSEIKFQVVDKKTGEIIHEFPKEDLVKQREVHGIKIQEGILVDSVG